MQPFQEASQARLQQKEQPGNIVSTAATVGSAYFALPRIMPFLSNLIPAALAAKGLAKVDPRLGKVINGLIDNGNTIDEAVDFIRQKVTGNEQQQQQNKEPSKQSGNVIEQYSPELFAFIKNAVQGGKEPVQAGVEAMQSGKFQPAIDKMEEDHKTHFLDILQSIFGGGAQRGQVKPGGIVEMLTKGMRQQPQQGGAPQAPQAPQMPQTPQAPQQQGGPGQQAIMNSLDKLMKMRGIK